MLLYHISIRHKNSRLSASLSNIELKFKVGVAESSSQHMV